MALAARRPPPSEIAVEKAFVAALAETTALRREGFTRELTDEAWAASSRSPFRSRRCGAPSAISVTTSS